MRIGVLSGGGDVPGLNPAIRGCVMRAIDFGWEVVGISEGWRGLIEGLTQPLEISQVEDLMDKGGTILGTSRTSPYKVEKGVEKCLQNVRKLKLDAIVAMGGEDTLGVANKLYKEHKMKVVGVPKTMDNDLSSTDYTFGFDTSVTLAMNALEVLKDTGKSHRRIMVLEVMGRHAGWVALFTAIGGGADWVLLPEEKVDVDSMCKHLKKVYERKKVATVVVSEGIEVPGKKVAKEKLDQFGHMLLKERGVGEGIAEIIKDRLGIDTRASVIGHMQRGGAPTLFDRMLGVRAGVKAAELIKEGKFGQMVSLRGTEMVGVSLEEAVGKLKTVSREWIDFAHTLFK
ncbi:ATP-dependent 6-phosphofructokinase [bacterium]|nr:ATP-dependent 6-phosphofructokinase [bacterium]NIN91968.1 ATP-dependent 6-phosphofructokinase [bacterium]NIO18184.1 ATP-dependent 6-phosphofructokinase [bacterium]NIO73158.1 ATP-dependent 6-phosphofructokinase [bacterium]